MKEDRDAIESWNTQLRKGLAEMVVLAAVCRLEQTYGYQLLQFLASYPGMGLTEGTVYPLLAKLARQGYLTVTSKNSTSGPPRRYYEITQEGTSLLRKMEEQWDQIATSLQQILPDPKRKLK